MQKEALEREQAIKKWAVTRITANYEDFERLLGAKLAEINARLAVGGNGGAGNSGGQNVDQWIAFHEPKIIQQQTRVERLEGQQLEMKEQLRDKVSLGMVQNMIGQNAVENGSGAGRLSNFKSDNNLMNQAPVVNDEESVGKGTEDFGGYDLNENENSKNGMYEQRIDDSIGQGGSVVKQRAALNINHSATPIHLSQGSIDHATGLDLDANRQKSEERVRTGLISAKKAEKRSSLGQQAANNASAASISYGQSQFEEL